MKEQRYLTPAICSLLIIGMGQIIKGDSDKGLKWILFFYLFYPAVIYASLMVSANLFIFVLGVSVFVYPLFWLYNIYDAYTRNPKERMR